MLLIVLQKLAVHNNDKDDDDNNNNNNNITLHVAQIVKTKQLQHYIPRNMACFRYIFVNMLHKGNDKDYDDNDDDYDYDNNCIYAGYLQLYT